mmetsp:Transcript_24060/g.23126  ORF Transcript_24060/g.23126 Transcript_24060/m.23126 type:complete len:95 (-) Transcript_24060:455-739(-)|eukprot:CAMPEP_0119053918 /NCGR_PEP_ID=MMETSP1177-20130426/74729_1 /TAXON_ID=2985 /ORGANISM="Ochromonas sp, Strain CCMP1899" /LENGTH=94 /DNA_ID=CAMNT_0007033993 /DNA_START=274 /DNA_END=558 /DNA_ORIENTATION=+
MAGRKKEEKVVAVATEYRNEGRLRWERLRMEWLTPVNGQVVKRTGEVRSKSVDPEDVIERIFSPSGNGVLSESIPLPQMVDILIDFWEADGLFD